MMGELLCTNSFPHQLVNKTSCCISV